MAKKNKTTDNPTPGNDVLAEDVVEESGIEDLADVEEVITEDDSVEDDAEEKIHNLEEALLRSRAELDNALKRSVADIEKAHKYGVERLLNELLPVVDNLEHALKNFSDESSAEDKEGVELTLKSLSQHLINLALDPYIRLTNNLIQLNTRL